MSGRDDEGFTFIELLIVIVILGVLAIVVVAAVNGIVADAEVSACKSDGHTLATAAEAYFAQRQTRVISDASGVGDPDGYEQTLVNEGFLRSTSQYYDLDQDGNPVLVGPPCN